MGSDLTCSEIAAAAKVPLRTLFEGMKVRTGMSPHRFVMSRRIARAQALLTSSSMSIVDIAICCGFSSQQHLTSVISNRLGSTPMQIRRRR
jgi:AraC family transcriptional regulator